MQILFDHLAAVLARRVDSKPPGLSRRKLSAGTSLTARRASTAAKFFLFALLVHTCSSHSLAAGASTAEVLDRIQPNVVKIYGAGGFRGLEPYQSGMIVSADGHILTVFSYVLDTDQITAVLADGRRFEARLLGADPRLDVAVLKIDAAELPHFDLGEAVEVDAGTRILALSNLFGIAIGNEPASVQHGVVSVKTGLAARRGVFNSVYRGPVYVLDAATNNPGAAGGALVTRTGQLVGMIGKELRNALNHTWLNYALPIGQLRESVEAIRAGRLVAARQDEPKQKPARSLRLEMLGIVLVPDVLERTPPYVDHLRSGSPAARAGLRPDDLILLVGGRLITSCKVLNEEMEYIDFEDRIRLTVLRGGELVELDLQYSANGEE